MKLLVPFAMAFALAIIGCSSGADSSTDPLYQGGGAKLWHTQTIFYCFVRPQLSQMPSEVTSEISTQQALEDRWMQRVHEFIAAIDETWQAVGLIDFVPRLDVCEPDNVAIYYRFKTTGYNGTPNGGHTYGIGELAAGTAVEMSALFLTQSWQPAGSYHMFTAAHEMGHVLGFRHEQDRPDSTCNVAPDRDGNGILLTPYDPSSIMNYCNAGQKPALTAYDRAGFKKAYAFVSKLTNQCADSSRYCGIWAQNGECSKNPSYMQSNCCASCASSDPCRDENSLCAGWASSNQCSVNPEYMQRYCCSSCFL